MPEATPTAPTPPAPRSPAPSSPEPITPAAVARSRSTGVEPAERPVERESGSLVTEYGLLAVVAATIAGVVIQWASGGALVGLFNALISRARDLVGA